MRNTAGGVFCDVTASPFCMEPLDAACVKASDNCWTLVLTPNPERRGLVSSRCDEEKRERGSVCPMTLGGARQMPIFSWQLFKATQSGESREAAAALHSLFCFQREKHCHPFSRGATDEVGRSPRCRREDTQRGAFFFFPLRATRSCPHSKESSLFISHYTT